VAGVERTLASTSRPGLKRLRALVERLSGFEPALEETYRWGRDAMTAAYRRRHRQRDDWQFRQWRRALAYHGCQMRLLAEVCPAELQGRLEVIRRLGDLLDEDLELTRCSRGLGADPPAAERRALIEERQLALRALARPLGKRLYGDRPTTFLRRLRGYWQEAFPAPPPLQAPLAEAWRRFYPIPVLRA
jgi:hypothetical protein